MTKSRRGRTSMKRIFKLECDQCGKPIIGFDYIEQTFFCNWDINESARMIICKDCWEKQKKKVGGEYK